jgi:uncharacterized protein YjbI with pentapeptide repeats
MLIEIKHRFTNDVLFSFEGERLKDAVLEAVSKKAYLSGADLSGAYLSGADLRGAYLSGADISGEKLKLTPISILNLTWDILITDSFLTIGCQRHQHTEWAKFSDDDIANMESRASEFWNENKTWLLALCAVHYEKSLKVEIENV